MLRAFVDLCHLLAAMAAAPWIAYQAWKTGKYRTDWPQRRGFSPQLPPPQPGMPRVWIHAVSVGEVNAIGGLIKQWRERAPSPEIVLSATTDTGIARARERFPDLTIFRYPLDLSWFVRRAFDRIRPDLIVLVELEVWFHFVTLARRRGIPVCIVNGRLSERSARLFACIRPISRRMFKALTWIGAQDETYAERFRRLGAPPERVAVTGSLKWETAQITDAIPGAAELACAMGIVTNDPASNSAGARLWVCGSTGPGEEPIILEAYKRLKSRMGATPIQLTIVPRKPERFDEVANLIESAGFCCVRRSRCPDSQTRAFDLNAVHLIDTMGELRKVYSLADVVFVGRSLVPMGGSDMMEVAALAKPIVVGPHTENFRDAMGRLVQADAIRVIPHDILAEAEAIESLFLNTFNLLHAPDAASLGARAREVVQKNVGATDRTLERLRFILHGGKAQYA